MNRTAVLSALLFVALPIGAALAENSIAETSSSRIVGVGTREARLGQAGPRAEPAADAEPKDIRHNK
jgi:hypothetical protein